MKKLITCLFIIGGLFLTSCEETESPIYDGTTTDSTKILTYFDQTNATLGITIDDVGSVNIPIGSSKLVATNRTVKISIVDNATTADPTTFTVPNTVVIPANEYFGTLTIDGADNGVETTPETLTLKLDSVDGGIVSTELLEVTVVQVCPVPDTFMVGNYLLTDNGSENFGTDVPVTLEVGDDSTIRKFSAVFLPNTGVAAEVEVTLNLVCNKFSIEEIDINVGCGGGTLYVINEAGKENSNYNINMDVVHTINYTEDPQASCGDVSIKNFTLTKQ